MAGWVRLRGPLQVRPCKLGRRIHAAHAPATGPTPPSTDFRDLLELLLGSDPFSSAENGSDPRLLSISGRSVDQGRHLPTPAGNRQRWGGVGWQDRWRHGWRHRAPMDGFTACPANLHRPAIPRNARCCCCCCLCSSLQQVQGTALQRTLSPRSAARWHQREGIHGQLLGVIQPGADLQIVHFMIQSEGHIDLAVGIRLDPLLGQHHLALR